MKKKLGKQYLLPEQQVNINKDIELEKLKLRLASGLRGEAYKKAMRQYQELKFGKDKHGKIDR